ncbi:PREDICTED: transcription factor ORG2-like isoform X1 [Nicotiana attenuata]|uniref:transcription factor ORG2-like isoform X1 n=1 Tax=Nicotiana attenuata TaxID=49451 RepID=UPI0009053C89|nr:PREDICTED: transcription factor ORG2-like isoform X1 [Nicotiana attenuata]
MLAFSSSIFPNMSSEWSFEEAQKYDQQNNYILQNENTNDLFEGLHIDNIQYSPSSYQQQYYKEDSCDNQSLMAKKLSHNASERNRRKKMNFLYSTLRSLLPPANLKKKKLSFPATISYVQEYIPELKKEIEKLSQTKDLLLSKKAGSLVQPNNINQRNTTSSASSISISASPLCNGQVLVQISTTQTSFPISQVFQTLEEDGYLLLNATSFKSSGEKIFHNLHFQVIGIFFILKKVLQNQIGVGLISLGSICTSKVTFFFFFL